MIYWQICFEKYLPNYIISILYNFYFIFRWRYLIIKKNRFWKHTNPNSWFWTSTIHSNSVIIHRGKVLYVSNDLKNLSTTLHTQFIYLTYPFKKIDGYFLIFICKLSADMLIRQKHLNLVKPLYMCIYNVLFNIYNYAIFTIFRKYKFSDKFNLKPLLNLT